MTQSTPPLSTYFKNASWSYDFCCCSSTDHGNLLFFLIFHTPYLARNIDVAAVGGIYPNKILAKIHLDASNSTGTEIQEQKGQKRYMIALPEKWCYFFFFLTKMIWRREKTCNFSSWTNLKLMVQTCRRIRKCYTSNIC